MRKKFISIFLSAILTASFLFTGAQPAEAGTQKKNGQSTSPYTDITYTHADVFDGLNIYNGIDVSKYNKTVDWEKVKAAGIEFVFVRVGYRGYGISGTLAADVCFESHVTGALAAGLKVGLYYYTEAINTEEAIEEAQYCIEKAKDYNITLPIVYDYETTTVNGTKTGRKYNAKLSKAAATKNCQAFCDTIQNAGYTPMIYANKYDLSTLIDGAALGQSYKIWLANYTSKTTYTGAYEFWQYSEKGSVDGISGNVDCNYWYTDETLPENPDAVSISTAKAASVPAAVYTGKNITPAPKLTLNGKELISGTDYTLSYSNNLNIGTASIKITGKGNYKGSKSISFKILPKKVTSFKKKSASKSIKLTWAANPQADGYQIWRKSTYNEETHAKVKTIKPGSKTTWTNTKLENDREYYYAIRAYKKVDNKNYFSSYTYLTASTLPGSKKAIIGKKTKLYTNPSVKGESLATIPKSTKVTYLGRTYVTDENIVHHIKYTVDGHTYSGYIPSTIKLTF